MRQINPYIVGNPIKDQVVFFGRQDIFRDVMQVLHQRASNAIVLYGQRRIGKTSVLLQLEKRLSLDGEFTPVYFDLQDKAAKSLPEVLYELSQHISRVAGHTIAKPADFSQTGDYFRTTFLPQISEKVANGGLVLLFDEFDVLDSPARTQASEAFFPYLREWMSDLQKVKFVFVIGRRPEDLSVRTMSTFKGIQSTRVSFLTEKDSELTVRQSEKDQSLLWEPSAVRRVIELSNGHPYFMQLLCSVVWENTHEDAPETSPTASEKDVNDAISEALKFGANAFNWLWDGLPPAERVVAAAMAEIKDDIITDDKLIEMLNLSGVRLVARELEFAPETLIDWEVLTPVDGGYRFSVPLLRRWILLNRPLRRVKDELDRIDPLADGLFQTGQGFYNSNNLPLAEQQLREAVKINPNHLKARLLLGRILLETGKLAESVEMFDAAYQYDERSARADLIKSLLALSETQDENAQINSYERILKIQSDQPLAREKLRSIKVKRGEAALVSENWEKVLEIYEALEKDFPQDEEIQSHLQKARAHLGTTQKYQAGLLALQSSQFDDARELFAKVISENPSHGQAAQKLVETIYGKISIIRPMDWQLQLIVNMTAFAWTLILVLFFGVVASSILSSYIAIVNSNTLEIFGLITVLLAILLGVGVAGFITSMFQTAISPDSQERKTLRFTLLTHFPFGLGLFYLSSTSWHRWFYAIVAMVLPVLLIPVQLFFRNGFATLSVVSFGNYRYGNDYGAIVPISIFFSIVYVLSFIDVIIFYYYRRTKKYIASQSKTQHQKQSKSVSNVQKQKESTSVSKTDAITNISYGKAIIHHLLLGRGLFYVDAKARRKWFYPLLFVALGVCGVIVAQNVNNGSLAAIRAFWHGIVVTLFVLYLFSFLDVLFTAYAIKNKTDTNLGLVWAAFFPIFGVNAVMWGGLEALYIFGQGLSLDIYPKLLFLTVLIPCILVYVSTMKKVSTSAPWQIFLTFTLVYSLTLIIPYLVSSRFSNIFGDMFRMNSSTNMNWVAFLLIILPIPSTISYVFFVRQYGFSNNLSACLQGMILGSLVGTVSGMLRGGPISLALPLVLFAAFDGFVVLRSQLGLLGKLGILFISLLSCVFPTILILISFQNYTSNTVTYYLSIFAGIITFAVGYALIHLINTKFKPSTP